jgi:hypothetical protein
MKGTYIFDVSNLPEIDVMVRAKVLNDMGFEDSLHAHDTPSKVLFVDFNERTLKHSIDSGWDSYATDEACYNTTMSVVQLLQLEYELPVPQVALALVITDDLDKANEVPPRMITAADLNNFKFKVTRDNVMEAAEQACRALGV